jgi:hypothetical protein
MNRSPRIRIDAGRISGSPVKTAATSTVFVTVFDNVLFTFGYARHMYRIRRLAVLVHGKPFRSDNPFPPIVTFELL